MKKLFAIILMAAFMATGVACTNMSPTQQGVASGAALGTLGGAGVAGANTIAHIADGAGTHNYPGETLSYSSPDNDAVVVQGGKLRQNIQVNIGNTETKNIDVTAQGGIFVKKMGMLL